MPAGAWTETIEESCRSGDCSRAVLALRSCLTEDPADYEAWCRLGDCYAGACGQLAVLDLRAAADCFRAALRAGEAAPEPARAALLEALANVLAHPAGEGNFETAILCYRRAADIFAENRLFRDWARVENNLGLAYCDLPDGTAGKWNRAIREFEKALLVRTRERDAGEYAATLQNLGTAYRAVSGNSLSGASKAIRCYRRALGVYRSLGCDRKAGAVHNNIGNALLSVAGREPAAKLRRLRAALRHFDEALLVRTRESDPYDHAITQLNRGQALAALASERGSDAAAAAECFRQAGECFDLCERRDLSRLAREFLTRSCAAVS